MDRTAQKRLTAEELDALHDSGADMSAHMDYDRLRYAPTTKEDSGMPQLHKFHVVMTDGTERNITAGAVEVNNGTLNFVREDSTEIKVMIAPHAWNYCELESMDDRGHPSNPPAPTEPKRR